MKANSDRIARVVSAASALALAFCLGAVVIQYRIFPYRYLELVRTSLEGVLDTTSADDTWFRNPPREISDNPVLRQGAASGVNLVTYLSGDRRPEIKLMTMTGKTVQKWDADWFRVWPEPEHLAERELPRQRPGTHIHGAVLLQDGSVVYNYTSLGMVRLDVCGNVMWRLPYRTHHSVFLGDDGNLWVPGQKRHESSDTRYPNLKPPFYEETLLRVSQQGQVLEEVSLFDLLRSNGLQSFLYLSTASSFSTEVSGDFMHANDIEPFSATMTPGFFVPGDVVVSMRNANAVFVFNMNDRKVKFLSSGLFTRQHDPDFVDGNTISVFDNNNIAPEGSGHNSRIVMVSAPSNQITVYYEGSKQDPFYTDVMGKHQWLPGGNLLVNEPRSGRAFELDPEKRIVWEYVNLVEGGLVGLMEQVSRLPAEYEELVADAAAACPATKATAN
jgi:hypothetical protein